MAGAGVTSQWPVMVVISIINTHNTKNILEIHQENRSLGFRSISARRLWTQRGSELALRGVQIMRVWLCIHIWISNSLSLSLFHRQKRFLSWEYFLFMVFTSAFVSVERGIFPITCQLNPILFNHPRHHHHRHTRCLLFDPFQNRIKMVENRCLSLDECYSKSFFTTRKKLRRVWEWKGNMHGMWRWLCLMCETKWFTWCG